MTQSQIKFAYLGTPQFSTLVLDELLKADLLPSLIVTTPDRRAGRGLALTASPVKEWALAHLIPVIQPEHFDETTLATFAEESFDLLIIAAYGKILPKELLALPLYGSLNVHPSLLPRYRGTSPVESQILADEKEVGVSVILMDEKVDHGPIVGRQKVTVPEWPVSRNTLNTLLWSAGGKLLAEILPRFISQEITTIPQNHDEATFTKKITKEDGELTLTGDARENYLKYLAYEGWPGTFFFNSSTDGQKRFKITRARLAPSPTGSRFIIERVIPEGGTETNYTALSVS